MSSWWMPRGLFRTLKLVRLERQVGSVLVVLCSCLGRMPASPHGSDAKDCSRDSRGCSHLGPSQWPGDELGTAITAALLQHSERRERAEIGCPLLDELRGAVVIGLDAPYCNFREIDMGSAVLRDGFVSHADFSSAVLEGACLDGLRAAYAEFGLANMSGVSAQQSELTRASLCDADLNRANLEGARLPEARLRRATLDDADCRKIVAWGADCFRLVARRADFSGADLSEADFTLADLRDADFAQADLSNSNMRFARLDGATFARSNLVGVDFCGATGLLEASLEGAVLDETTIPPTMPAPIWWKDAIKKSQALGEVSECQDPALWSSPGVMPDSNR